MANFNISIDLSGLEAIRAVINRTVFPLVNQAINAIAQQTAANWREEVMRAKLWSGEKDAYAASISYQMTSDFSAVVESDYRHASEIENGRPPRDLKRMLDTSLKVRRTLDGARFLIIPFRHNVNAMPAHVYAAARQLDASRIIGQTTRRSGEITGFAMGYGMVPASEKRQRRSPYLTSIASREAVTVNKNVYAWGQRLLPGSIGPNPRGKADRFAGMVRFDTSTAKAKSSSYMTFRVMSERSTGWIVPAQPGLNIVKKVVDQMQPLAKEAIEEAFRRTVSAA